jgi:hypothetical protein
MHSIAEIQGLKGLTLRRYSNVIALSYDEDQLSLPEEYNERLFPAPGIHIPSMFSSAKIFQGLLVPTPKMDTLFE